MPEFSVIRKIIYFPNHKCYFQIRKQIPTHFDSYFYTFEVAQSQDAADVIVTNAEFFRHETMHLVRPISAKGRNASSFVVLLYSATIHTDSN